MSDNQVIESTSPQVQPVNQRPYIQYTHTPVYHNGAQLFYENNKTYPNQLNLHIHNDQNDSHSNNESRSNYYAKNENFKPITEEERPGFIRKVYSLVIIQLMLTTLLCIVSYVSEGYRNFQLENSGYVYLALGLAILIEIIVFCTPKCAWKVPQNYIFLFVFTLCESYMISQLCSFVFNKYGPDGAFIVLMAAGFTLAAVLGLTLYACKTKTDYTTKGAFLFMCCMSLFIFGIMSGVYYENVLSLFYSLLFCLLFGVYLIYDTQLIIGGNTHQLTIDDYIIGAMIIYVDIIYLFASIIMIILSCLR